MELTKLERHIDAVADEIVNTRDFCGNERNALLTYQLENGIVFTPTECVIIAHTVEGTWKGSQVAAGVVAPLSTSERFQAYKDLE